MIETRSVETAPGMVFDVSADGRDDAPLVLMLHGFGVSRFLLGCPGSCGGEGRLLRRGAEPAGICRRCSTRSSRPFQLPRGPTYQRRPRHHNGRRPWRPAFPPYWPRLGCQPCLANRGSAPGAARLAYHTVPPSSSGIRGSAGTAGWRAAPEITAPYDIPASRCRTEHPGGQCELAADALDEERRAAGGDRGASVRDRESDRRWKRHWRGIGREACVISRWGRRRCQRCLSGAIRTTRLAGRQPRGRASSSPRHTSSQLCRALGTMPPTRCRNRSTRLLLAHLARHPL